MSRHTLGIATGHLVLGWDPPLQTFFLQVHDRGSDCARIMLGCDWREIATVDELFGRVKQFVGGTAWDQQQIDLRRRLLLEQQMDIA